MNKKYIITKNEEISNIVKKGNKKINDYYIVYCIDNDFKYNRYCVSVSKKIGNAVLRNRLKRVTKEILRKSNINNNRNYVIILRRGVIKLNYLEKEEQLLKLIKEENR